MPPARFPQRPWRSRWIAEGQTVGLTVAVGVRRLYHVHAASVSAGDAAAFVEDQIEQFADISL